MKKTFPFLLILALASFLLASCPEEEKFNVASSNIFTIFLSSGRTITGKHYEGGFGNSLWAEVWTRLGIGAGTEKTTDKKYTIGKLISLGEFAISTMH